jgi:hypothetical protein
MTDKIFLVSILKPGYGKFKIIKILRYASSYANGFGRTRHLPYSSFEGQGKLRRASRIIGVMI